MTDDEVFDEQRETVMELVLSSDEEFPGTAPGFGADSRSEERRDWWRATAARFLPGVDAGAVFALGLALVSLTTSGLIDVLATRAQIVYTYSLRSAANSASANNDPLAGYRHLLNIRTLGQGAVAAAAVLLAVLVLARWQQERHTRWSRPVAQAALGLGLVAVVITVLLYTGAVAGLPSPAELRGNLGSSG
jgi:hypothetical protein